MKHLSNEKGNSLVELIMVMMLLILFGVTIYALIFAGSQTQQKISNTKSAQVDARIAISYLSKWIRQNDIEGAITIQKIPDSEKDALVIYDAEYGTSTWIFENDGYLLEYLTIPDMELFFEFATPIVPIEDYSIVYNKEDNSLTQTIAYDYNGNPQSISSTLRLHSPLVIE